MNLDWRVQTPACIELIGPSQAGKSTLIKRLIEDDEVWDEPAKSVVYCVPEVYEREYLVALREICDRTDKKLILKTGEKRLPDLEDVLALAVGQRTLFIADDLLGFTEGLGLMKALATLHSHHNNISCLFCVQNPFAKIPGLDLPTLSRNTTGRLVLYQTNDWQVYRVLNGRLFPDKKEFLLRCLVDARDKYDLNYVFINTHPRGRLPRRYICYTGLFKDEKRRFGGSPLFFDLQKG